MRKQKYFIGAVLAMALISANSVTSFAAGWTNTSKGWKYQWGDGSYCHDSWVHYKDHWYYFGSDQLMRTGWIQRDGTWYFAADSGELQGGIMNINNNVYYFDTTSCKMNKGYLSYDGHIYNFTENGTEGGKPYIYNEWNSNGTIRRGVKFGPVKGG